MADTPKTWTDMSRDERDSALLDALVSGVSPISLANILTARPMEIVEHLGSLDFQTKARAALPGVYLATKLVADFLQPAQILTARAGKDGIGHKEFMMLTEKFGQFKADEPADTGDKEQAVQAAMALIQRDTWKLKQQFSGPKAEA